MPFLRNPSIVQLMKSTVHAVFALICCITGATHASAMPSTLPLAGTWRFALDRGNVGESERWFDRSLAEKIELPGSCEQRGFGDKPATPEERRLTRVLKYTGPAWYQRDIEIPAGWSGKRVELFLERCHWETTVWIDGRMAGMQNSLSTPHQHDLGALSPGKHTLTVCVDNSYKLKIGVWGHSIAEDTQTNWNGIIGAIELRATDPVWIRAAQVFPGKLRENVGNQTGKEQVGKIAGSDVTIPAGGGELEIPFKPAATEKWDEFSPVTHTLDLNLTVGTFSDTLQVPYALRDLAVKDKQFVLNGRPVFMRGPVDECVYPLTGYPPTDKASWMRVLGICKSHGFNFLRFHSWCPPKAAFEAGDELGFLFQIELPLWTIDAPPFGQDATRDQFIHDELTRILDTYGNHPSFGFMAMGNESHGSLDSLTHAGRARDPRPIYRIESGGEDPLGFIEQGQRGVYGPRTDWDRWTVNAGWIAGGSQDTLPPVPSVPMFSHEVGQWAMYPKLDEVKKYTGTLSAHTFDRWRKSLEENHMLDQAKDFAEASGKLSVLLYKDEIEASLRSWPYGGIQILEARDYPGQGVAIVGWLDAFWDSKGLITPEKFREFCAPTVCLLRMPKRVLDSRETFTAKAQLAHYGPKDIVVNPTWKISDDSGRQVAAGNFPRQKVITGKLATLGDIAAPLNGITSASRITVTVSAGETSNSWHIWVYPPVASGNPATVSVVHDYDASTRALLAEGRRVLLLSSPKFGVIPAPPAFYGDPSLRALPSEVRSGKNAIAGSFMPTFWNLQLFNQIGTLGILCDPRHPAFEGFPTEKHSDWQWADLLGNFSGANSFASAFGSEQLGIDIRNRAGDVQHRSKAFVLTETPPDFRPILQVIDNQERNAKLGSLFETRVGPGKLLVCGIDLDTDLAKRPAARQLRKSLLDYCASGKFAPAHELPDSLLTRLLTEPLVRSAGTVASADSEMPANEARNAIDGNPATLWHTPWGDGATAFPHAFTVQLKHPHTLRACTVLPRQDVEVNGMIKAFEVYASNDGRSWGRPLAKGEFPQDRELKRIFFPRPVTAKFIKLVALSGFDTQPFASIAEFDVEE